MPADDFALGDKSVSLRRRPQGGFWKGLHLCQTNLNGCSLEYCYLADHELTYTLGDLSTVYGSVSYRACTF